MTATAAPREDTVPALVTLEQIHQAAARIAGYAVRTPLVPAPWADTDPAPASPLWLKPELLQPVGAFKIRGAVNAIAALDADVRARGILAHSSGNHAQAVAWAARAFGTTARIVVPDNAPARKVDATRALGAHVDLVPVEQRFSRPLELQRETGMPLVPPFDDPFVVAGQGTAGLEIAEDAGLLASAGAPLAAVLVPVSGGGLIAGIAAAITALLPDVAVIGVEPELAGDAAESFRTGQRVAWQPAETARTIADGLRTFSVGELPWEHIRRQVRDIVTVTEDEIREATRRLTLQGHLAAEPSGAVAVAAHLFHGDALPTGARVALVSGGNIDPAVLRSVLAG